jgi:hypothetical protein
MAIHEALLVALGAFAGGFVSGLAGFGTGLIALGFGCTRSSRPPRRRW